MNEHEKALAHFQNTFLFPHMMKMQKLMSWPNAQIPIVAQVNEIGPYLCKLPFDYVYRDDPESLAEIMLLIYEYFQVDVIFGALETYNYDVEGIGADITFFHDHFPDINRKEYLIKGPEDLDKIKFRGMDSGRYPYIIKYAKAYSKYTGLPFTPETSGPWTIAANLYGMENLLTDTLLDPEFVTELLCRIVDDLQLPLIRAYHELFPTATAYAMPDVYACPPVTDMPTIKNFIVPAMERLYNGLPDGVTLDWSYGWFGKYRGDELQYLLDLSCKYGHSLSGADPSVAEIGPEVFRKKADEKHVQLLLAIGAAFLENSSPKEIIERTKNYVLTGKNGDSPFVICAGIIAPNTKKENIEAFLQAAKIYGALDADENTPYTEPDPLPDFESFLCKKIETNPEGYTFKWLEKSGYSYLKDKYGL